MLDILYFVIFSLLSFLWCNQSSPLKYLWLLPFWLFWSLVPWLQYLAYDPGWSIKVFYLPLHSDYLGHIAQVESIKVIPGNLKCTNARITKLRLLICLWTKMRKSLLQWPRSCDRVGSNSYLSPYGLPMYRHSNSRRVMSHNLRNTE